MKARVHLVEDIMCGNNGDFLLITYKKHAKAVTDLLDRKLMGRIPLMQPPEGGREVIPYHGGTHGSNRFHRCDSVVLLGYPRLNEQDYLLRAIGAYGAEQLIREFMELEPKSVDGSFHGALQNLPSVSKYITHHLAAEIEQAIFRTSYRNMEGRQGADVYFPFPDSNMMRLLQMRFPEVQPIYELLPIYFAEENAPSSEKQGGKAEILYLFRFSPTLGTPRNHTRFFRFQK